MGLPSTHVLVWAMVAADCSLARSSARYAVKRFREALDQSSNPPAEIILREILFHGANPPFDESKHGVRAAGRTRKEPQNQL